MKPQREAVWSLQLQWWRTLFAMGQPAAVGINDLHWNQRLVPEALERLGSHRSMIREPSPIFEINEMKAFQRFVEIAQDLPFDPRRQPTSET